MDNLPDLNKASKRLERAREGARPGGRPPPPLQTNQELGRSTAAAAAAAASARPVGGDVRLQSSPSARSRSRRPAGGSSGGKTPTLSSSRKTCFISCCATEERRGGRGVRRALRHPFPRLPPPFTNAQKLYKNGYRCTKCNIGGDTTAFPTLAKTHTHAHTDVQATTTP